MTGKRNDPFSVTVVSSWEDAKTKLRNLGPGWAFRGQRDASWALTSSLERCCVDFAPDLAESALLRTFQRQAHHYLQSQLMPDDLLEWLALMQHHGAPTRLQDWTRSPYVAAYFAIEDSTELSGASAVWAIDIEWCKSNAVKQIRQVNIDVGDTVQISSDFGRAPQFEKIVMANVAAMVLPVAPTRMNERLSIQQGLFLCPGRIQDSFMDNLIIYGDTSLRRKLLKIVIPSRFRVNALQDLAAMNVTRTSLFPGLDGFSQSLKYKLAMIAGSPQVRDKLERGLAEGLLYL